MSDPNPINPDSSSSTPKPSTSVPKRAIPKGVVLGKDGKPCRSCTSFASWAANTKSTTSKAASSIGATAGLGALTTTATTTPSTTPDPLSTCPPDVEALGRSSWTLLHSIAAQYPSKPTLTEQANVTQFMGLFSKLYPCWVCAEDFQAWIARNGVKATSRDEFGRWLCEGHNEVNRKLGKEVFDCERWEERWRTGWKDGRCD